MRLCASVLAIAVFSPLAAFAQAPADQPPAGAAAAPPAAPPPAEPPPAAPPPAAAAPAPAAAAAAPAAAPAAPAPTWKDLITISGLIDAYYMYNFTGSTSLTSPQGAPIAVRNFDLNSNSFTLNYAKLSVAIAPKPVGIQLDVGYGATGAIINSNAPIAGTAPSLVQPLLVENAYATASFGNLTLDLGKFTTWAGAEVIEANLNPNYSRSIMFFYIPLVHTGLRASYQVTPEVAVKLAVVNGWNDLGFEGDINKEKTIGFEVAYTGADTTAVTLNGYFGNETAPAPGSTSGAGNTRSLIDLVGAHTFGPLALNLNVDYIHESGNTIYDSYVAGALMGKYTVNEMFALAARAEYVKFGKPAGADKTPAAEEFTITGIAPIGGRMEIRAEIRGDFVQLPGSANNFDTAQDKNVFTGTLAFLSWF